MTMIKTILADDHRLFCEGLEKLLTESGAFQVIQQFHDGRTLLEQIRTLDPELVILDIEMPGLNGLDVVKRLTSVTPTAKLVILSMHEENVYASEARALGAHAYLSKSTENLQLLQSLKSVMTGQKVFPKTPSAVTFQSPLSDREMLILKLIAKGKTSESISKDLQISHLTVKAHRRNMIQKLNVSNSSELLAKAFELGLI
jgi:DNA-binding NarL/FixJ family response regulator